MPWLLRHKVELPDPIEGYVSRPQLEERCEVMNRRLTVLQAPGGFGKTALLATSCRRLRDRGVAVAWLSLDENDGPGAVSTYLAMAFERAGLDIFDRSGAGSEPNDANDEADSQADYRVQMVNRAIESHGAPCVLALDEVERLKNPKAVGILNALLARAPRNLRLAAAYRERPPGLDIAMFLLEGHGVLVTVEDLRFSALEIARFFDMKLPPRELASVAADSVGWPLALRIYRNTKRMGDRSEADGAGDTVGAWIESRLWRGLAVDDREFLLDLALFDWVDAELVEEAARHRDARRRIETMRSLTGLLQTSGGDASTMRLHPLIKDHCASRLFRENPERYRSVHRGIAQALARRTQFVDALRHAVEAGGARLIGEIAESAGGVLLWLRQGLEVLRTIDSLLTSEVISMYPRMALVRCVVRSISGDLESARQTYRQAAAETDGFTHDRAGGDDRALQTDHIIVRGLLHVCGCKPYGSPEIPVLMGGAQDLASNRAGDPLIRGMFSLGLCLGYNQTSEFERVSDWAERARAQLGSGSPYLAPHVDFQAGSAAMAQGRSEEAERCYERALAIARASHLRDAGAIMIGEILKVELTLERNGGQPPPPSAPPRPPQVTPRLLGECGAWVDIYAASTDVVVELAMQRGAVDDAMAHLEHAWEYARRTERVALTRFLAALRVDVLVRDGQIDDAGRMWRLDELPATPDGILDLSAQSWREVEVLAGARLRLFIARESFDEARSLAQRTRATAENRGLRRTLMRGLVLSMVLEHRAGDTDAAAGHLAEYLRLVEETDYLRPLVSERVIGLELLERFEEAESVRFGIGAALARDAEQNIDERAAAAPGLSARELEVLLRLNERQRDREIAAALHVTTDGVRYHLRNIFAKLGARSRFEAVHRARSAGLLPAHGDDALPER